MSKNKQRKQSKAHFNRTAYANGLIAGKDDALMGDDFTKFYKSHSKCFIDGYRHGLVGKAAAF